MMSERTTRTLLAIAAFLSAALIMGVFAGPARGVVLCSVALLCLAACRTRLPALWEEGAQPLQEPLPASKAFWEQALIGVCVLDSEHRVLWCNGSAAAHFETKAEAATGRPIAATIAAHEFASYLAAGDFAKPLTLETDRGEGAILSIWLVPHLHSQWLLLSRDVTLETRAEILRRDGVADALHELCTPVTVLAGYLDTVRRLKLDPWRSSDYLNFMEQQCRRMQSTIGDLVSLWTLEAAPVPSADERVDVVALLAKVRADMEALSGDRHRIVFEAQSGLGLVGSVGEIASAFSNLAINAIRYTPPGGVVRVLWRATPAGAELAVEDNGIGIAAEHIPRLTERFYQVNRRFSRAKGGSGLGLAIVKNVLERHQATLEIESEPGTGSRFSAKFPAHRVIVMVTRMPAAEGRQAEEDDLVDTATDLPITVPAAVMNRLPDIGEKVPA
jgi:two-component system phosphate regulon sensor histidine kinase PhoR